MANIIRRIFGPSEAEIQRRVQDTLNQYLQQNPNFFPLVPLFPKIDQKAAVEDGYASNADVYSIVSRKAQMAAGIPFYVYRVKGKEGRKWLREYKSRTSSQKLTARALQEASMFKVKAMEEVEEDHPINELLQRPNDTDSAFDYFEQVYGFLDITGNSYMYKEKPSMGANQGIPKRLGILPSPYMQIIPDGRGPVLGIGGYNFFLWGNYGIKKEDVIHVKYFNPDYQPDGSHLYGMTPLRAGAKTLTRSNSAVDSSTAQFQHGGPAGFVFNKSMSPDEQNMKLVGGIKTKWEKETWGNMNRGKVFFSAGDLGYIRTGLSPVDLQVLESEMYTFRQLCRIFKMPSAIFNDNEHATMANMEQFYQAAYTDGVIPMVMKTRDTLNSFLLPDFGDSGEYFIDADYSGVPVLQQDMKEQSEWLKNAFWLTPNEKREYQKFAPAPDPNMNKIWLPSGYTLMDDLAMPTQDIGEDVDELDKEGLNPYK